MNNIQVIIFPDQFTEYAIKADSSLINLNAKLNKAGFFERIKLKSIINECIELKTALVQNGNHSLVLPASLVEKINRYAMDGEVLTVNGFVSQDKPDSLFDLDGGMPNDKD